MLHIRMISGEELTAIPVEDVSSVRDVNLGDDMNPKTGVIYPILLKFLLGYMNHKPF